MFIIYEGPSTLNGAPIVAVLTSGSDNTKTGAIPQLWILPADEEPHVATRTGADAAVCGGCRHRPAVGGSCYVVMHRAPLGVYRAWKRGRYAVASPADLARVCSGVRAVRLGAYGDPVALPFEAMQPLLTAAREAGASALGYTHQWGRKAIDPRWRGVLMASADSPADALRARAAGWRPFRVALPGEEGEDNEVLCASVRDGSTCAACRACDASPGPGVWLPVHGSGGKEARFARWRTAMDSAAARLRAAL